MSTFNLPIEDYADNTQRIQISDDTYDFRFRWNHVEEAWYCHIGLNGEDPKVQFKMVTGMDLLAPYQAYEEVPEGVLYLIDLDQGYGRVGRDDIGQDKRFRIIFAGV